MKTTRTRFYSAVAVLAGFLLGVHAGDNGRERLTEAASAAIQKYFPGTSVRDFDEREKDHDDIFVVRLHEGPSKRDILVEVTPDGQLLEIDEDLPTEELPERIKRAVKKAFPRGEVRHAEMETEMKITYRIDIKDGRKERRVKLTRGGRIFEIEKRD